MLNINNSFFIVGAGFVYEREMRRRTDFLSPSAWVPPLVPQPIEPQPSCGVPARALVGQPTKSLSKKEIAWCCYVQKPHATGAAGTPTCCLLGTGTEVTVLRAARPPRSAAHKHEQQLHPLNTRPSSDKLCCLHARAPAEDGPALQIPSRGSLSPSPPGLLYRTCSLGH